MDNDIFHAPHKQAEQKQKAAEEKRIQAEEDSSTTQTRYKYFTTHQFKTHFSRLLRQMTRGDFDAAVITSYGRDVGVFFPHPDADKS